MSKAMSFDPAPVSVIVPCFQAHATLERAVDTVVSQTLRPAELILVDDASDDGGATVEVMQRIQARERRLRVRVLTLARNQGPGGARNAAWAEATQPWLAFLDADDGWHPRKLELQAGWLAENPEVALCAHGFVIRRSGAPPDWPLASRWSASRVSYRRLLPWNRFVTPSVVVRRDLPHRFRAGRRYLEDFLLWLEILAEGHPAAYLDLPLACLFKANFGEGGLSADLWKMERAELSMYRTLQRERRLSRASFRSLAAFSLLKFARRVALSRLRGGLVGLRESRRGHQ